MKTRMVLAAAICVLLLTSLAAAGIYLQVRRHNIHTFDQALQSQARVIASMIEVEDDELDFDDHDLNREEFSSPKKGGFMQIWMDGNLIHQSASLANQMQLRWIDSFSIEPDWLMLPDGRRARALRFDFHPLIGDEEPFGGSSSKMLVSICLARDFGAVDDALAALRAALIGSGLLLALLVPLTIWLIARRTLRPVDALAAQLSSMDVQSIDRPIEIPGLPGELQPILQQFNALMSRLHSAFERERHFSADIAHELRTPVAGLRATLEVALSRPREGVEYQATLAKLLQSVLQMQSMTESLMMLAELEAGRQQPRPSKVDLAELTRTIWTDLQEAQPPNGFVSSIQLDRALIETDPELAGTAIRNILHNAMTYVNHDGKIEVVTGQSNSSPFICVANTGSQIASEETDRVFDRFWRGDQSRSQTGRHFGLGLPLSRRIVDRLGGQIKVESTKGGKFQVTICWNGTPSSA